MYNRAVSYSYTAAQVFLLSLVWNYNLYPFLAKKSPGGSGQLAAWKWAKNSAWGNWIQPTLSWFVFIIIIYFQDLNGFFSLKWA